MSITQNGDRYDGSGLTYPLPASAGPLNNLITFTVLGPYGGVYFFQGVTGRGVEFQGRGSYYPVSDPSQSSGWGFLSLPLPPNLLPPTDARPGP